MAKGIKAVEGGKKVRRRMSIPIPIFKRWNETPFPLGERASSQISLPQLTDMEEILRACMGCVFRGSRGNEFRVSK